MTVSDAERAREIALSIRDVIGTCVCPEDFSHPDCGPCAVAHAVEPALSAARAEGRAEGSAEAREACAKLASPTMDEILLHAGEMTAQERRTVTAVLKWIAAAIRGRKP